MKAQNGMQSVIVNRNFRLLWLGQGASLLGDQFYLIAAPWLVLTLTHDPLALGAVLALAGIPRAVFMLVGGAITDRYSPRAIMLISDLLRLALTALMAVLVFTGTINLGIVYAFALLFGTVSGFFTPASSAILPRIVALTFLVSVITLWRIERQPAASVHGSAQELLRSIYAGIQFVGNDLILRTLLVIMTIVNFLFNGWLFVGIPVLANTRMAEGAAAFGLIMSAYGGGNLVGIILAGTLPRLNADRLRFLLIGLIAGFGITMMLFAFLTSTALAFGMMLLLGIGNGYLAITLISVLQQQTPREMLGRMMSLVMLASLGLAPLSQALAGVIIRGSLPALFIGSGCLMLLTSVGILGSLGRNRLNIPLIPSTQN